MYIILIKNLFKLVLGTTLLLMISTVHAQFTMYGPTSMYQGESGYFSISGPYAISSTQWSVSSGGTINYSSSNSAAITFSSTGSKTVSATVRDTYYNYYYLSKSVSIGVRNPNNPTISSNGCGTATLTRSGSPPSGITWYWQGKNSSGTSTTKGSGSTYTPNEGNGTYYIRARSNSTGQWSTGSGSVSVTIANYTAGTIGSAHTICYGGNPSNLTNSSSASGGSGGYSYQWQYSSTGTSGWTNISGATGTSYDPPSGLTANRWYRRSVVSCSGQTKYSNTIMVTVWPDLSAGAISSPSPICYGGDPENITVLSSGGGNGTYNYQWQYSSDGSTGWTDISGATGASYNPPSGLTSTRWYRRRVQSCSQTKYTLGTEVVVRDEILEPAAPSISSVCGSVTLTRSNPPSGITWYWQATENGESTNNSNVTLTLYNGPSYYLRGRNSFGCWGPARTITFTVDQPVTWYADIDGDGFGNPSSTLSDCTQPAGYVSNNSDYDDSTNRITNLPPQTFYLDKDGDGFGEAAPTIYASFKPLGYANNTLDQCPDVPGATNGCDYQSPVFSDENYIYSRTYQSEMASSVDIKTNRDVLEGISYYDGLGRSKQQIAIKGSISKASTISPNYPAGWVMDWTEGATATPFFNRNGNAAENNIITGPDPFGKSALIWACGNDPANNGDGGWNTDYITVDKTKTYRYTVWVRRDFSQDGRTYHGTQNVDNLGGGANTNPYFFYGDLPQLGEWYLLVGIVHPYTYSGSVNGSGISGVYDMQGNKVLDGTEFKWGSSTTTSRFRSYLYYATDVNVRQYFYQPILEIVDGNEVPLADMFDNGGSSDLISHVSYDSFGRQDKEWLPYPETSGSLGSYRGDVSATTQQYYQGKFAQDFTGLATNQVNAYSEKDFEASPLSRILEQAAPGKDWQLGGGHGIKFDYETNTTSEVRLYNVTHTVSNNTYTPSLVANGHYAAGELTKNVIKDENHDGTANKLHTTEEFTDKLGRVVLKRTYAMVDNVVTQHDTYYVYDDYGNLTYVLPPLVDTSDGVSAPELSELCYQYKYDHRNRLVEKKIPGKGWEYIVYNTLDQPVLTQDAVQRPNKQWLFTKYDAFGRVAYTGLHTQANVISRETMQGYADNTTTYDQYESKQGSSTTLAGTTIYYSNNTIPQTITEIHTINYYDDYVFDRPGLSLPVTVLGQNTTLEVKGLATGTKVRVLGSNDWITTMLGYDDKRRPIWNKSTNDYLNTSDLVETKLDFIGKVLETKTTHQRTGYTDIVIVDTFTYDDLGRLLTQKQTITGQPEETLVNNGYDELGQLATKQVGGGLQTVDYTYNVRSWLKQINDPNALGNDLFAFGINYNTQDHGGATLYNGNIAETEWKTANDNTLRWYKYGYDALNRLDNAQNWNNSYNLSYVTYDKNGNIMSLKRHGWQNSSNYWDMDVLDYDYDSGNKLLKVTDTGNKTYGFKEPISTTGNDYRYDANGNLVMDKNKGIGADLVDGITYNHLNLPTNIDTGSGTISYVYDAIGTKLKKEVSGGGSLTEYAGGFIYQDNVLQFFGQPEGYVTPNGMGGYDYVYQYKDHLGNIRLSYVDNGGTLEIVEESNYYPFGLTHKGYNSLPISPLGNSVAQKWKFGGKEYDDSFNEALATYYFGARNYDPALGRWMNLDPLAEQMRRHSPYNYAFDNPVFFIDPDGMAPYGYAEYSGNFSFGFDAQGNFSAGGETGGSQSQQGSKSGENCCGGDDGSGIFKWLVGSINRLFSGIGSDESLVQESKKDIDRVTEGMKDGARNMNQVFEASDLAGVSSPARLAAAVSNGEMSVSEYYATMNEYLGTDNSVGGDVAMSALFFTGTGGEGKAGVSVISQIGERFPGFVPLVSRIGGSASKSEIYPALQKIAQGEWIKVYQGGHINGKATEIHFYIHKATGLIANPKTKYSRQVQKVLKDLGYY